jgi:amidohydrolase
LDAAVVTVGCIKSGSAANIIADSAYIEGTLRSLDGKTKKLLKTKVELIAIHTAKALGAYARVDFIEGYEALVNHDENLDLVKKAATLTLGKNNIIEIERPTMGVEDFSFYLNEVPGAFFFLGSGFPNKDNPPLHSANFIINEECIKTGIMLLTCLTLQK